MSTRHELAEQSLQELEDPRHLFGQGARGRVEHQIGPRYGRTS